MQPTILEWFCATYDCNPSSTKITELIVVKLKMFIIKMLQHGKKFIFQLQIRLAAIDDTLNERDVSGANRVSQTGFVYNGLLDPSFSIKYDF